MKKIEIIEKIKEMFLYLIVFSSILGVVLLIIFVIRFVPISVSSDEINNSIKEEYKERDYNREFVKYWNKNIYDLMYSKHSKEVNFQKYEITEKDENSTLEIVQNFLLFDKVEIEKKIKKLEESQYNQIYIPYIEWLKLQKNLNYKSKNKFKNINTFEEYIADAIDPNISFSKAVMKKIIELNEFCYYFDKHKKKFYKKGYNQNIKSCKQVEEIMQLDKKSKILSKE